MCSLADILIIERKSSKAGTLMGIVGQHWALLLMSNQI